MRVAVTTGRLSGPLAAGLRSAGHEVVQLVEREASGPSERRWYPDAGRIDAPGLADVDAVANVYEANIWVRWTDAARDHIRGSQVTGTLTVVSHLEPDGRCQRFANLSSTYFYGDRGETVLDAGSGAGGGWLARSTVDWDASARHAPVPTVLLRTPMVLGVPGGQWEHRRGVFAGRMGHGRQWRSWIHVVDWVDATIALLAGQQEGPVVLAAPEPVRDADFVHALAHARHRWTPPPVPERVLRARFGPGLTDEVIMASQRIFPLILPREMAYHYRFPRLEDALADLV